jgi:hypothetical protein
MNKLIPPTSGMTGCPLESLPTGSNLYILFRLVLLLHSCPLGTSLKFRPAEHYGNSWAAEFLPEPMLSVGGVSMKRRSSEDCWQALNRVTDAAERFVNRTPRLKRLEAERQDLLDAIRQAQLLLSVKRLPLTESVGRE